MLPPPSSIFFPSTTLFRSRASFLLACRDGALRTAFPYRNVRLARDPREAPMSPDSRVDVIENRSEANPVRPELQYLSGDRKSTRLNSSHAKISNAVFCLKR